MRANSRNPIGSPPEDDEVALDLSDEFVRSPTLIAQGKIRCVDRVVHFDLEC